MKEEVKQDGYSIEVANKPSWETGEQRGGAGNQRREDRRCREIMVSLHDVFDIFELELIISIELFNEWSVLVPVFRLARLKESGRGGRGGRSRSGSGQTGGSEGTFHHEERLSDDDGLLIVWIARLPQMSSSEPGRLGMEVRKVPRWGGRAREKRLGLQRQRQRQRQELLCGRLVKERKSRREVVRAAAAAAAISPARLESWERRPS